MAVCFPGDGGLWFRSEAREPALARASGSVPHNISTSSRPGCLLIKSRFWVKLGGMTRHLCLLRHHLLVDPRRHCQQSTTKSNCQKNFIQVLCI
ncbi:hypothetical protein OWV82_012411 [Melia azedarach]|uniref:Uncharacterized protein n=1 Tax=Melia azedarach TaxID=155640 RepID=A0ACC1Y2W5_MELAZ|nr:hypothetical protein OWV82_012411 [Melia azedarach]